MATIERQRDGTVTGATARSPVAPEPYYFAEPEAPPRGAGWLVFSAIALGFAGVWAVFEGILAISSSKVFTDNATYVFSGLNTWGWIVTALGVVAVLAAFSIVTGSQFARWFGISAAILNAYGQLMFLHANPWWSMAMIAVSGLVVYGLAVYGGPRARTG